MNTSHCTKMGRVKDGIGNAMKGIRRRLWNFLCRLFGRSSWTPEYNTYELLADRHDSQGSNDSEDSVEFIRTVTKKATGSCALLEKRLTKASAELAAESEQRVVLEERVNKLLIVNEDHRHMIEILEQEADTLRSGYSTMKDYYDKMMKQRDRIRASFLEQSITIDKMLATRSEMSVLSAEKEILEIECEISDTENRRLVQQLESTRVASEDMKERTKTLNNGVLSLSSENDNLRNELEKASASETEVDTLRTECNGKRMKFDEFMNESIGKLITCSGDFSGEETMLVTRNQIEILPEETEVGNKCYEVAARESNMSGAQVGEFGSAGEGTDLSEERLREAVVTLSSAKQAQLEKHIADSGQILDTKNNILRHQDQQLSECKERDVEQNAVIQPKYANKVTLEFCKTLQGDSNQISDRKREQDECIEYENGLSKQQQRLEKVVSDTKHTEMEQNEVMTIKMEGTTENLPEYIRRIGYGAIKAKN